MSAKYTHHRIRDQWRVHLKNYFTNYHSTNSIKKKEKIACTHICIHVVKFKCMRGVKKEA